MDSGAAGGDRGALADAGIAHLSVSGSNILSAHEVEGIDVHAKEIRNGISAKVTVREGVKLLKPVHLCFGVLHKKGTQKIVMDVKLEKNSSATFIAHCIFPKAEKVRHIMDAVVDIGEGAEMRYSETHYKVMLVGMLVL